MAAALAIAVAILAAEVIGAAISGSLALLAGHMLTDVAGLSLAFIASSLSLRAATPERTWGYRRAEVLAAATQAALLLAVGAFILLSGFRRLLAPPHVESGVMFAFALLAILGNAISIAILARIQGSNLNTRAARLEAFSDLLGALAVLVAAVLISAFGWDRADGIVSIGIALLILPRTIRLLRESVDVLLEATPRHIDLADVRSHVLALPQVISMHDVHATQVASDLPVLTAHIVVEESCFADGQLPRLLDQLQTCLADHFDVEHSKFQF
ncbi:MAG: cation diffusion facilitator family transporter [Candidatus Nanopelagicales bacterium]